MPFQISKNRSKLLYSFFPPVVQYVQESKIYHPPLVQYINAKPCPIAGDYPAGKILANTDIFKPPVLIRCVLSCYPYH